LASRHRIAAQVRQQVRQRAHYLCEYCHASEQWQYVHFTVDHVIPLTQGGTNTLDNLALACFHCNRRKSDRLTAVDPVSGKEVPLFNPRRDRWDEHFIWSVDKLLGTAEKNSIHLSDTNSDGKNELIFGTSEAMYITR